MSYFNRLTDIVTCNLSSLLAREPDPQAALTRIIGEMEEGLAGANRSVSTASASVRRLEQEIDEHRQQTVLWTDKARKALAAGDESSARASLLRKSEIDDVVAGLEQQLKAAIVTRDNLTTTLRALEARLAEARRRQQQLAAGGTDEPAPAAAIAPADELPTDDDRRRRIDAELERLRATLQNEQGLR